MKKQLLVILVQLLVACDSGFVEPEVIRPADSHFGISCNNGMIRPKAIIHPRYQIVRGNISFWISTAKDGELCLDTIVTKPLRNEVEASVFIDGYRCGVRAAVWFDGWGWLANGNRIYINEDAITDK